MSMMEHELAIERGIELPEMFKHREIDVAPEYYPLAPHISLSSLIQRIDSIQSVYFRAKMERTGFADPNAVAVFVKDSRSFVINTNEPGEVQLLKNIQGILQGMEYNIERLPQFMDSLMELK